MMGFQSKRMRTYFTFCLLFISTFSLAQSNRYQIDLNTGGYELTKTVVKDYGTHQLVCGTDNVNGTIYFWFAKMAGETVLWAKSIPAHPNWAYMDISPTAIAACDSSGNIIFTARGNKNWDTDYTAKVIKLSPAGNLIWSREISTELNTYSQTVYENNPMIVENDGVIISMAGRNHLQLTKINGNGEIIYSKQLKVSNNSTGYNNPGHLFIPNSSGGYFAGFECEDFPTIVSLDASMNVLWTHKISSGESAQLRSLLQSPSGELFIGGKGETGAFIASLSENGNLQDYRTFTNSGLFSIDQLFLYNDSIILANGRTGYTLINTNSWESSEILFTGAFCSFHKSINGWSFGSAWNTDYYLDFNPESPQCFAYEAQTPNTLNSISPTSDTTIDVTIVDLGEILDISEVLTTVPATVVSNCYLSVEEEEPTQFSCFPNPVQANALLSITSSASIQSVILSNIQGNPIASFAFGLPIIIPEISTGVYFISATDNNGNQYSRRLVVE